MIPIRSSLWLILMLTVLEHNIIRQHLFPTKWARSPVLLQPLVQTIPMKRVLAFELPQLLPLLEFGQAYPALCSVLCLQVQSFGVANCGVLLLDEFDVLAGADGT